MTNLKWNANNIPDQTGRVAIVTGSSSGIGKETARVLAQKNATVIIAVRNIEKGHKVAKEISSSLPEANLQVRHLDLANLESVKIFSESILKDYEQLDLLINNAGVMMPPYAKTSDGYELQFGTNHLGHFALTNQLLPLLVSTPSSRIVNVSSIAHKQGHLDFNDLNWEQRNYKPMQSYADSKIANIYFTYELRRKLSHIKNAPLVTAAHPGWTATELQRHAGIFEFLNSFFAQDVSMGALPTLRAAIDKNAQSGDYYGPKGFMEIRGYPIKVSTIKRSQDLEISEKLWRISEELSGVTFNELKAVSVV